MIIDTYFNNSHSIFNRRNSSFSYYNYFFLFSLCSIFLLTLLINEHEAQLLLNLCGAFIFCLLFIIIYFITGRLNINYQRILIISLSIRIIVLLIITLFPPEYTRAYVNVPAIFPDEVYYTERAMAWSKYSIFVLHPSDQYEYVIAYMSIIYKLFGLNVLWIRLSHVLFGVLTSVLIYYTASLHLSKRGLKVSFWIAALLPNLVMWSSVMLKEAIFILGISLLVASAARLCINCRQSVTILFLLLGGIVVITLRAFAIIFALFPFVLIFYINKKHLLRKGLLILSVLVFLIIIIPKAFNDFKRRLEYYGDSLDPLTSVNIVVDKTEWQEHFSPIAKYLMQSNHFIQVIGYPVLLLVSPTHTAMTSFLKQLGDRTFWTSWMTASLAISWWLCLPLLIGGIIMSIKDKNVFWLTIGISFIIWFILSSYGRGLTSESVRLREHFAVFYILLTCKGIDSIMNKNINEKKKWFLILELYYIILFVSSTLYTWRDQIFKLFTIFSR